MQQFQSTTAEPEEQALAKDLPLIDADLLSPAQTAEANKADQEQSALVNKMLSTLEHDARKRQQWNKTISALYGICVVVYLAAWALAWLMHTERTDVTNSFSWIMLINVVGWGLGCLLLNKNAAAELTRLDDVRCIGALVDIWRMQEGVNYSRKVRRQAAAALTRLLPRLKANDATLLKESQRGALRGVLAGDGYIGFGRYHDAAFMISILKALEQVGDWKSAPFVRSLALDATNPDVRAAAKECLPYLQSLAKKQALGENLLRASSATDAAGITPETLLRPAADTEEARPDTLLRPTG